MKLNDALRSAEIVVIEGDKRSGKNTFFFHLMQNYLGEEGCIFITPQGQSSFHRRLDVIARTARSFRHLDKDLDVYFFKPEWKDIKQQYGFDFLLQDIERIFQYGKGDSVVIHHFEDYFELQEKGKVEQVIFYLTDLQKKYNKKLFFIINTHDENYEIINNVLAELADIKLLIQIDKHNNHLRAIDVVECIYPLTNTHYAFKLHDECFSLVLAEATNKIDKLTQKSFKDAHIHLPPSSTDLVRNGAENVNEVASQKKILLISKSKRVQKIHQYLLSDINDILLDISDNTVTTISKILAGPDIIIYNPDDENKVDLSVCEIVRENKLDSKLFYLSNKLFIRQEDRSMAHHNGCDEIFAITHQITDYLIVLEKYLYKRFYTERLSHFEKPESFTLFESEADFQEVILKMIELRLYFTVFTYYAEKDEIIPLLLYKTLNRGGDYAYIDTERNQVYLLCLNTTKEDGKVIYTRLKNQQYDLHLKNALDAVDLVIDNKVLG